MYTKILLTDDSKLLPLATVKVPWDPLHCLGKQVGCHGFNCTLKIEE